MIFQKKTDYTRNLGTFGDTIITRIFDSHYPAFPIILMNKVVWEACGYLIVLTLGEGSKESYTRRYRDNEIS